jgi:uncharacterized protein (TIGR03435 family)
MRALVKLAVLIWVSLPAFPQAVSSQPYFFDVASVKLVPRSDPGESVVEGGAGTSDPGRLGMLHVPLELVIARAFNLQSYQLVGLPNKNRSRIDIIANVPPGATKEEERMMLQNLLIQRFALIGHWDVRNLSVYELVVVGKGPRLKRSAPDEIDDAKVTPPNVPIKMGRDSAGLMEAPPGAKILVSYPITQTHFRLSVGLYTMAEFSRALHTKPEYSDRPVIDGTGLTGAFTFNVDYGPQGRVAPEVAPAPPDISSASEFPDFSTALRQQLGLNLIVRQGEVKILVIDHIDITPSQN